MAIGLEADVHVLDVDPGRLGKLSEVWGSRIQTIFSTPSAIERVLRETDLLIGAVLVRGHRAPRLVTREMVSQMRAGSVIVDVAIDEGGCVETIRPTSHSEPTYPIDGVLHYAVPNIPGAVPHTSTHALCNASLPYLRALANLGVVGALRADPGQEGQGGAGLGEGVVEGAQELHGVGGQAGVRLGLGGAGVLAGEAQGEGAVQVDHALGIAEGADAPPQGRRALEALAVPALEVDRAGAGRDAGARSVGASSLEGHEMHGNLTPLRPTCRWEPGTSSPGRVAPIHPPDPSVSTPNPRSQPAGDTMTVRALLFTTVLLLPGIAQADSPPVVETPVPASMGEPWAETPTTAQGASAAADAAAGAPVCEANDPATAAAVLQGSRAIEAMASKLRAELAESGEAPIVLNNRGYGYGVQQGEDPAHLLRVLEREAAGH